MSDGKLTRLLDELLTLQDVERRADGGSGVCTPARAAKHVDIGRSVPRYSSPRAPNGSTNGTTSARMDVLRDQIIAEIAASQQQQAAVESSSPYATEPYRVGSPGRTWRVGSAVSLPVGERVAREKTYGKRVFQGGIPTPIASDLGHGARFGKRMNIEAEAHRRALDITAISGRHPDPESIFSERYTQLRNGILSVDGRKPCIRLPSVGRQTSPRDQETTAQLASPRPALGPGGRDSEYQRTINNTSAVHAAPELPRVGLYFALPTPPHRTAVRETITAAGHVVPTSPRRLVTRDEAPFRPVPQTARTLPADDPAVMLA